MRVWLMGLAWLLAWTAAIVQAEDRALYNVGVAQADITPDYPIRLNGFGFRRAESEGISQRIHARALAVSLADGPPLVLITVDSLGVRLSMVDQLARRLQEDLKLPREHVALTFTHSHCTPKVNGASDNIFSQPIPPEHQAHIDRYSGDLAEQLEQVARRAIASQEPAELAWGIGSVDFAKNRRTAGGPVDHALPVLVVRNANDQQIRAVYTSYACHCVTLSFNQISGDWAGYAAEMIERTFPGATALVSIGCGSDSNPSSGVTGDKVAVAESQGLAISAEVERLVKAGLKPMRGTPLATLNRIPLPLNPRPTRDELQALASQGGPAGYNATTQLARLDRGEELLAEIDYPIQTWSFGESLSIVFLAGEVCADYSLRLKRELNHERLWINGYSNDFCAYIPSERLLQEGGYGGGAEIPYFALPATFQAGLEQQIVDEVLRQVPAALHLPRGTQGVAPKSPEESLQCLRTHDNLRVELVVAEPLVSDPVAIDFGPDGSLWVAEMSNYGQGVYERFEQTGRIRRLQDHDGDGRFDQATTFVSGLRFPTDVKVWRDGVLICDAPDILLAVDTNGDGQADTTKKLFTGFEVLNAQARVNSLRLGLDNWIYGACGLFGGHITSELTGQTVDITGRDFRLRPDTGEIQAVTGRTQQGRARNDWGDWFGCTNGTLALHFPVEDRYLLRNPHSVPPPTQVDLTTRPEARRLIPAGELVRFELSGAPGTPTSACGLDVYRDRWLGTEYQGNVFTCEPVHQLVHRLVLQPRGATYEGVRAENESDSEFLASTDRWFRPVQVRTGPDGALWVVDMYRYVIEHARWIPQATLAELDVFAGQGRGRIYRVVPREASAASAIESQQRWQQLEQLSSHDLIDQLDQPNGTIRDLVQQLLIWRRDPSATAELQRLVREARLPEGQLHALCTLDGLAALTTDDLLAGLSSKHAEVVRHAMRLAETRLNDEPALLAAVLERASSTDPRLRYQLAQSLGEASSPHCAAALAELSTWAGDDAYLRSAILSSLRPDNVTAVWQACRALSETRQRSEVIDPLVSFAIAWGDVRVIEQELARALPNADQAVSAGAMTRMSELLTAIDQRQDKLPRAADDKIWRQVRGVHHAAVAMLPDSSVADAERQAAINLVARPGGRVTQPLLQLVTTERSEHLKAIAALISAKESANLQQSAVAVLARIDEAALGDLLLARWDAVGPQIRAELLDALLSREAWTKALLAAIQAGRVQSNQFDAPRRERLLTHRNSDVREQAQSLLQTSQLPTRAAVVDSYREALSLSGDRARGREHFRKACATCHRLEDYGHVVGPDLAALTSRAPEWLLTTILDPNREVDARYVAWTAIDIHGRSMTGIIAEESGASLRLREAQGKEHEILRRELDELRSTERSIMPEGLERDLTPQDIADVLAYVTQFDVPPKQFAGNVPTIITANPRGELSLTAATAEIRGGEIVFELPFRNLGYWHGEQDRASWRVELAADRKYDVYLDWACAAGSSGNRFRVEGATQSLAGVVASTGGWDRYQQSKIGTLALEAGSHILTVRAEGPQTRGALFDLREVRLVPVGKPTQFAMMANTLGELPRAAAEIASFLLDESQSTERRQAVIDQRPGMGPAIVGQLIGKLGSNSDEEYRRIPWIWRVAVAVAKRNDDGELRDLLDASLPTSNQPLRDWQAVVIGGGVINGLSQIGEWPDERVRVILAGVPQAESRWSHAFESAARMADDEQVPDGTRYDALRMIALRGWEQAGAQLVRYLATGVSEELQMGAVSGLADLPADDVAAVLVEHLSRLSTRNRQLAIEGLLRTEQRSLTLLQAMQSGRIAKDAVDRQRFADHPSTKVQSLAREVWGE